jgi:iron complex transport system substrate-binding protein
LEGVHSFFPLHWKNKKGEENGGDKEKMKTKMIAFVEIVVVLCSVFLVAIPAIAADQNQTMQKMTAGTISASSEDDYVLGIYGNANEDDTIDMRDLTYVKLIFFGKKPETELADAKYDGKINPLDFIQIKLIIVGKEKELTFVDVIEEAETVRKPVKRIIVELSDAPEVLRALNALDKIVGVTDGAVRDGEVFFPGLSKLPCTGSGYPLNRDYEAILSLQPDVLIPYTPFATSKSVWPSTKRKKAELKEKLPGISIVALDFVTLTTFTENVRKLGYIIDKEDEHQMMVIAGGRNIAADSPIPPGGSTTSVTVDPEWVIMQNPDIIIRKKFLRTPCYSGEDPVDLIATWEDVMNTPELANVNAVKNRRVYTIANMLQTGPHCFHPELYGDLDQIHQEYLDRFQHLDYDLDKHGVFVYHPVEHPDGR